MKKTVLAFSLLGLVAFYGSSCKKGCTNPKAYNYNPRKTKDNGSCKVYTSVQISSIDIHTIEEYNSNGVIWDGGNGNDLDNNNTMPDLYVTIKAENGYSYVPSSYYPTVVPSNVNKTINISPPLLLKNWERDVFWVYFYEVDLQGSAQELMDSIMIRPYVENSNERFKDTLDVFKGNYSFTANMQWNEEP